jgi:hypothetical protein
MTGQDTHAAPAGPPARVDKIRAKTRHLNAHAVTTMFPQVNDSNARGKLLR